MRLIEPKTFRLELDALDCIDKFGHVVLPITKLNIALERSTVDAVTVVRCRDCELWNDWDSAGKESLGNYVCSCAHWSVEDGAVLYTRPTDYCSYGECKGGDE